MVAAAAAIYGGIEKKKAADANARMMGTEGSLAAAQGYSAEANERRLGAMAIGKEVAGAGQAGAGYSGSVGRAIGQSAQNAELNDLNIRYKAGLQKWSYLTQAGFDRQEGNAQMTSSLFRAGSQFLGGQSSNYLG